MKLSNDSMENALTISDLLLRRKVALANKSDISLQ